MLLGLHVLIEEELLLSGNLLLLLLLLLLETAWWVLTHTTLMLFPHIRELLLVSNTSGVINWRGCLTLEAVVLHLRLAGLLMVNTVSWRGSDAVAESYYSSGVGLTRGVLENKFVLGLPLNGRCRIRK